MPPGNVKNYIEITGMAIWFGNKDYFFLNLPLKKLANTTFAFVETLIEKPFKTTQMLRFFKFIVRSVKPYFVSSTQRDFMRLKDFITD